MKISHKSPKKTIIANEIADAALELKYLKEIYSKMAGDSPDLDVSTDLTKEQLLNGIAELSGPINSETGSPSIIQVTYAELTALVAANGLATGQNYLITDYQTTHTIPNTTTANVGPVEPLQVTAISANIISPIAYSALYPQDVIYYSLTSNATFQPGATKGYILRRTDTKQNNSFPFDFRHVKFRRWKISVTNEHATGNIASDPLTVFKKTGTNELYIKLRDGIGSFDDANYYRRFEFDNLSYIAPTSNANYSIISANTNLELPVTSDFADTLFFAHASGYTSAYNNYIEGNLYTFADFNSVYFGTSFSDNKIGKLFKNNNITGNFSSNRIANTFQNNCISVFNNNVCGNNMVNNSIKNAYSNLFGEKFENNVISEDFAYNRFTSQSTFNIIAEEFQGNNLFNYFSNNIVAKAFKNNMALMNDVTISINDSITRGDSFSTFIMLNDQYIPKVMYISGNTLTVIPIPS